MLTHPSKLQKLVATIQKLYPKAYADSTWDNTGLLVDSSSPAATITSDPLKILLTIDLTQSVVDEAIKSNTNLVLAYHPFIFRGLKSINQVDPQQQSLIKLIQSGISVYSPHTAIDAAIGGVNDWLVSGISTNDADLKSKAVIEESKVTGVAKGVGMGRIITLASPISLNEAIKRIKEHLNIPFVQLATTEKDRNTEKISTIAVCAGSGGGLFKGVKADLFYTGELSHHEALYFKESGASVIACNHSNTERGFLKVLKEQLNAEFSNEEESVEIEISKTDCDPYETV
ncbi:hypothetical protein CANARDRAFT_28809 [[Candida] arabinofermentans NRRL YB-2248]|uniref:YbgI/family dinuclear metal center protein n=1 Tax=[Candida] arabinofermentans NRRL YB-2248 TaxID=983967 RepID=A0A1E4T022_9ASCO|nr:hypothetical protein CANARDRAFT_28809 [[Candida] arabinofermentans NRRL YB-2248]